MTLEEVGALCVGVGAALVLGVAASLVIVLRACLLALVTRPENVGPQSFQQREVARTPPAVGEFSPDLAWPSYQRQLRTDLAGIARHVRLGRQALLAAWSDTFLRNRYGDVRLWWLAFPLPLVTLLACMTVAVVTPVLMLAILVVVAAPATVVALVAGLVAGLLRGAEWLWTRTRGVEASCPTCYFVSRRPAYGCPGCGGLHRDLRPGRLGVLYRRCACGTRLPTTVLRAARRLRPLCQRCGGALRTGAGAARDVRIPVFGDVGAGKTRFLYASLDSLVAAGAHGGVRVTFPDDDSRERADRFRALIRSGADTVKTSDGLPHALSCRIGSGATSTLLHLFDVAGERFRDAARHDELGFLAVGHGLVYVIDPFSLPAITDRLAGQDALGVGLSGAGDPESAYGEVVSRLRGSGAKPGAQRLAVVVSRADLLERHGLAPDVDSPAVSRWLFEAGLHNLVLAADREFAEVRYFAVASLAAGRATPGTDPSAPLRWLLGARGVRLPDVPGPRVRSGSRSGSRSEASQEVRS